MEASWLVTSHGRPLERAVADRECLRLGRTISEIYVLTTCAVLPRVKPLLRVCSSFLPRFVSEVMKNIQVTVRNESI